LIEGVEVEVEVEVEEVAEYVGVAKKKSATPLPSSIPPPLNPHHNRQFDDCVAGEEEVLIKGGEVEVEAEEMAEYISVGGGIMRNRAHAEALAIFYLTRTWRETRREGRWWRVGELMFFLEINDSNNIAVDNVQDAAVDVDFFADVVVVLAVNHVQDFEATAAPVDGDQVEDVDDDQVDDVKFIKKMPKRRKIYGRSEKRGGDRKLGDGGEGIEYILPVAPTRFAVALEPDTRVTPITPSNQIKYIPKKILFCQLQQMEENIAILVDL
jgi:hypothetical protein